jgi:4-amino-4-deoxy-L-arabinose transferase-like glycosyltransferase
LRADFPDHSPWLVDSAKFTDEGWWANAAVRHFVDGHWHLAGDYNPAVVVPVWPVLLAVLFRFTGVSFVAARALNVSFSVATVGLVYWLVLRYRGTRLAAASAALLLAASPFAFAFARLAALDTLIVFEWVLCLLVATYADSRRREATIALCFLLPVLLFTKTTGLVVVPAIFWLLWKKSPRACVWVAAVTGVVMGAYPLLIWRSRYAVDYRYFFKINAMAPVVWKQTGCFLEQLFENGLWVDQVLYPASLAVLLLSVVWLRPLWKNPLFSACWIALAAQAVFILRRQDDYAPRYFLVMLVPMILICVFTVEELMARQRILGWLAGAAITVGVVLNLWQIEGFLQQREYQFFSAARSIQAIVDANAAQPRLILGTSADQLSLMTGIPSINDSYTSEDLTSKVRADKPGWYLGWNDLDQDILDSLSDWRLEEVAHYPVFDRTERDRLTLYRMVPLEEKTQ